MKKLANKEIKNIMLKFLNGNEITYTRPSIILCLITQQIWLTDTLPFFIIKMFVAEIQNSIRKCILLKACMQ